MDQWYEKTFSCNRDNSFYTTLFVTGHISMDLLMSAAAAPLFEGGSLFKGSNAFKESTRSAEETLNLINKQAYRSGLNSTKNIQSINSASKLTLSQRRALLSSANRAYDQYLTKLAHSYSKHAGRHPEIWGKLKGPMNTWHDQAYQHLKDIYKMPGTFKTITDPKTKVTWIEKRLQDGRGLRLNRDYTFKGFID